MTNHPPTPPATPPTALERLREAWQRWPEPKKEVDAVEGMDDRCVGGIVCWVVQVDSPRFPGERTLSLSLMKLNPRLEKTRAYWFASDITRKNDRGDFDAARRIAEEAVTWKPATEGK